MSNKTQFVLVEAVSTFRMRYVMEVPVGTDAQGNDKALWALDTVTMNEAKEFSQEHLGEQIVSHRVLSKKDVLQLCDVDNAYCSSWTTKQKMKTFVTRIDEDGSISEDETPENRDR